MFHVRDRRTGSLFDPWAYLGPRRRKLLDPSWAGLFRKEILPHLPVGAVPSPFHARLGRPSKDAYTFLGALVFQQMHDLTDEETVRQLAVSIEWHYALDLPGESDEGEYVCVRTLLSMRQLLTDKKLDRLLFDAVTKSLASVFSVDTSKQRLDSVHITSNIRRLSRIGIFVRVITGFLTNLKRREPELFATLDPSFGERYLSPMGQAVSSMKTYALLSRVFAEQCGVVTEEGRETVAVKPPKEISSASLQNPSDPDAGYSGHKGQSKVRRNAGSRRPRCWRTLFTAATRTSRPRRRWALRSSPG